MAQLYGYRGGPHPDRRADARSSSGPIGEATDVVEKEMYSFERATATSSRCGPRAPPARARAYVEHAVHAKEPVTRWYYLGPDVPRRAAAERALPPVLPGGLRVFGDRRARLDAEMIDMLVSAPCASSACRRSDVARELARAAPGTRARYRDALVAFFTPHEDELERRLAAPAREQPAAHPRLEAPARPRGAAQARRRSSTCSSDDDRAHLDDAAQAPRRAGHALRGRPARSCAGSTTTRARSSRCRPPAASSARRTRSAAAVATTAWSASSAAPMSRPSASRSAWSGSSSPWPISPKIATPSIFLAPIGAARSRRGFWSWRAKSGARRGRRTRRARHLAEEHAPPGQRHRRDLLRDHGRRRARARRGAGQRSRAPRSGGPRARGRGANPRGSRVARRALPVGHDQASSRGSGASLWLCRAYFSEPAPRARRACCREGPCVLPPASGRASNPAAPGDARRIGRQRRRHAPRRPASPRSPPTRWRSPPRSKSRIGTDADQDVEKGARPQDLRAIWLGPYYEEKSGDYSFKTVFPVWVERKQPNDRASLYGMLYYNRRSTKHDADVLFPLVLEPARRQEPHHHGRPLRAPRSARRARQLGRPALLQRASARTAATCTSLRC